MLCKKGMSEFKFASENIANRENDILRYEDASFDLRAVVSFAKVFIDIDLLFIQNEDVLALRPYFYSKQDEIPEDSSMLSLGKSVCEYLKDQMQYSEAFLPYIPAEHRDSYLRYRGWIMSSQLMQVSKAEYTFPWETRLQQFQGDEI